MSRGKRNLHDEDLRLRCPGCRKLFATREGVSGHMRSTLHGEWITDFSVPEPASADTRPTGGDATEIAAPFTSGAVGATSAETPNPSHRSTGE